MLDDADVKKAGVENLRSALTYRLAKAQAALNAQASHILRTHSDLTLVEWRVIQLLLLYVEAPMSELAAESKMDKGQLSRRITTMVRKGLIVAEQDPNDQRKQLLRLTPKSIAAAKAMKPIMESRQKNLRADISADDLDTFLQVLDKVEKAASLREAE